MIYDYTIASIILAIIFFIISNKNPSILISIIIIFIIGYFYFSKINNYNLSLETNYKNKINNLNLDIKDREIIHNPIFYLNKFPVDIKYLDKDPYLIELIINIRFIKIFDYAKYTDIIVFMENFMKIYIFILADRYDINEYFLTFIDLRTTIIKELYSLYIITPIKLIYIFNINTQETIKKTIHNFIKYSRKMIIILQKYAKDKGVYHLPDTKYKPYTPNSYEVF
jgi:hypothetical protein